MIVRYVMMLLGVLAPVFNFAQEPPSFRVNLPERKMVHDLLEIEGYLAQKASFHKVKVAALPRDMVSRKVKDMSFIPVAPDSHLIVHNKKVNHAEESFWLLMYNGEFSLMTDGELSNLLVNLFRGAPSDYVQDGDVVRRTKAWRAKLEKTP